jgi:hypothetical protein
MITQYARQNIAYAPLTFICIMGSKSFHNGEVTMSHSVLPTKAANILVMHNSKQINFQLPDLKVQKLLTFGWRSVDALLKLC